MTTTSNTRRIDHGKYPPHIRTRTDSYHLVYSYQDIDPLADTVPPRHAVESDEEEDEYNPLSSTTQSKSKLRNVDVKIVENVKCKEGGTLIVVTGEAGKVWARGAKLGEQSGGVMVDGVQVRCFIYYDETLMVYRGYRLAYCLAHHGHERLC